MSGRRISRPGFTLIELLVVIAIIALLVSVLMPTLAKAKQLAKDTQCAVQLRNIGMGWQAYLVDSDETFPAFIKNMWWFYGGKEPAVVRDPMWVLQYRPLNPYVGMNLTQQDSAETFRCPVERAIPVVTQGHSTYNYYGNTYMLSFMLLYKDNPDTVASEITVTNRLKDVQIRPERMVLAGDCQWYYTVNDVQWDANFHNRDDRMNLLFLDGHVKFTQVIRAEGQTPEYSFITWEVPPEEPAAQRAP